MTEVKTCSHDNLFYLLSLPPNMASCRVSCGKNTTSGQHYFFFLSCWTECKPDATVTHHCLFRCKVVLQDKTGLAGGSWLALWMLNTKIVPYTTDNTKLMGNLFYSSFMVWFQILKQQKFNKEKIIRRFLSSRLPLDQPSAASPLKPIGVKESQPLQCQSNWLLLSYFKILSLRFSARCVRPTARFTTGFHQTAAVQWVFPGAQQESGSRSWLLNITSHVTLQSPSFN